MAKVHGICIKIHALIVKKCIKYMAILHKKCNKYNAKDDLSRF